MKGAGLAGAATVGGMGTVAFSGTVAASAHFDVTAGDVTVADDRGRVSQVTISPSLSINWQHFDEAVGKVFTLIEANVDGQGWEPVFRVTFWNSPATVPATGEGTSGPDSTGYYDVNFGSVLAPVVIADENGVPDYESINQDDNNTTTDRYKRTTDTGNLDGNAFVDSYHENWGYFGPAADVSVFDEDTDGGASSTPVELRYTFAFQTLNAAMLSGYVDVGNGTWDEDGVTQRLNDADPQDTIAEVFTSEEFVDTEGVDESEFWDNVFVEEVTRGDGVSGQSQLVMDGDDAYPSVTDHEDVDEASDTNKYALHQIADSTPAVLTGETSFEVTTDNLAGGGDADGDSGTDAEGAS